MIRNVKIKKQNREKKNSIDAFYIFERSFSPQMLFRLFNLFMMLLILPQYFYHLIYRTFGKRYKKL